MALSGVRSSCDMLARNCDLCRLAASSWRLCSSISRSRRALWMARADWVAKVLSRSMVAEENSPGILRVTASAPLKTLQRQREHRAGARAYHGRSERALVGALGQDVGNLHRLPGDGQPADDALALADGSDPGDGHDPIVQVVGGPEPEFLRLFIVLVHRAAVGAGQLIGPGYDGGEEGVEIQSGADGL